MRLVIALISGALFGLGLTVSGMTNTAKVQGWLDFFGAWDPTLAFVLGGAILPMLVAWRIAERRKVAVLGSPIPAKPDPVLDRNLIVGSAFFGVGWALVGLCPGPAIAVLGYGGGNALLFFFAMLIGMAGYRWVPLMLRGAPA
ncbi:DUF6691 family protein [Shimia ponticola]|uniref:DUF6691 family protein n=1 Tax=Shimia ponticola TaxID=2582893 RepID=UPI0011BE1589|nr:DUF6691 family protein [Shimia ponticola]